MAAGRADTAPTRPRPGPGRQVARPQPSRGTVASAGNAVVTAARVGRLLGRSGWRIARQLPGMGTVEREARRVRDGLANEVVKVLDLPGQLFGTASPDEQRVMMLVQNSSTDPAPLRTAMAELLDRSMDSDGARGRDYLFGTIVSQLVPDEARIVAALATGQAFAAVDVVAKQVGRSTTRTVLRNVSTVGIAAGVMLPGDVPTYLSRLQGFGLVEFAQPVGDLTAQFAALQDDPAVKRARSAIEAGKQGSAKLVRKTVTLSNLGREFWAASAPDRAEFRRRSG